MSAGNPSLPLGYSVVGPGRVAAVVTYLEMRARPAPRSGAGPRPEFALEPLDRQDLAAYRDLFRRVGEPWLWCSRLVLSDTQLEEALADPMIEAHRLCQGSEAIGLLELDFRTEGECELLYFGLVNEAIGKGAGRYLMDLAIERAWARPISRFFLNTCSFDHPRAVDFYRASGFRPYRLAVEVFEDPRLKGHLPRSAAPNVPIIEAL